jgi:hypothetical protein
MTEQPVQPEQPQQVTMEPLALVQPSPIQPLTGIGMGPQGQFVLVRYETVVGSLAFPLTPEMAIAHGEDLIRRGKAASSGLTLPPGVRL